MRLELLLLLEDQFACFTILPWPVRAAPINTSSFSTKFDNILYQIC